MIESTWGGGKLFVYGLARGSVSVKISVKVKVKAKAK